MATGGRVIGEKYKLPTGTVDDACSVCAKKNRTSMMKFCIDCKEHYCSKCTDVNEEGANHYSHNVTEVQTQSSSATRYAQSETDTCDKHPGIQIDTFCRSHDEVCCSECVNQDHGTCNTILISKDYRGLIDAGADEKIVGKIKSTKEQLINTIQLHVNVKKVLTEEKDKIVRAAHEFRVSIEHILENLERSTIEMFTARCEHIEKDFRENAETAEKHLSDLVEYEKRLGQQNLSITQTFIILKGAEKQFSLSHSVGEKCLKPPVRNVHFEPNARLRTLLQEAEEMGTCHFSSYPAAPCGISADMTNTESIRRPYTMVCSGQIISEVTVEDENTSKITGSCITPDGTVLLVDYENKKLKRLEKPSYTVRDFLKLEEEPLDICCLSNVEVMISMGQTIQCVSLGANMETIRSLSFSHECQFLHYHDGKIFVSDGCDVIRLYSMSGTLLSEINTGIGIDCFACSEDGNMIYIGSENELVAVDVHGAVVWTCFREDSEIRSINGVSCDGFGNVIVCGTGPDESNDVVAFVSEKGEAIGTYDGGFDHYYHPSCVCFDRQQLKLIVANCSGRNLVINDMQYTA